MIAIFTITRLCALFPNGTLLFQQNLMPSSSFHPIAKEELSPPAPEEICSICHESLIVARKLECNHKFHLYLRFALKINFI